MDSLEAYWTYLVSCSQSLIQDHGYWTLEGQKGRSLQDIVMVKLSRLLLKNLDQIGSCRSLRICILADNFLTRIEAVMECACLVKLDLKGNQIVQLPDASCWSQLKELQLLYLHDNNMASWNNINGLSGCLNLTALTLFDSPLSLKKNYRHCVVNNILSLKALDNYVISDEEIIQNWSLPFQFKAMKPHFHVNLYSSKQDSFETQIKAVYRVFAEINRIQAFYCPTLIIQRWIRGHLIRKSLGTKKEGAEKSIISTRNISAETKQVSQQSLKVLEVITRNPSQLSKELLKTDVLFKTLHVNLNRLMQAGDPEVSCKATIAYTYNSQLDKTSPYSTPQQSLKSQVYLNLCDQGKGNATLPNDKALKTDLVYFGFVYLAASGHADVEVEERTFHVVGMKVHQTIPQSDTIQHRKAVVQDIRDTINHLHTQRPGLPTIPQPHSPAIHSAKYLINRCHDTISFTPFELIEKGRRAHEKAEMQRHLAEKVTERQIDREVAKGHRNELMAARTTEARLRKDQDRGDMVKAFTLQRARSDQDVQKARHKHTQFLEEKRHRIQDQEMVCSFSRQHNSLARVVFRYNTWSQGNYQ
ncbi:leucine-rich repeat and IQ domain-containing protein 3 isoform X2 [Triplophysa dalaica]|uniref:leucine-rich repeat and IQ domain-containing protein 3 isoform X2 n=1 Tax=Triplophysa dalaica TaxID=1582913 RepID=UPI0024E0390E|nr:leucine-rich repeat and IQ domain-containing protein 3 isoform X2 [Triplophysa dalaica]